MKQVENELNSLKHRQASQPNLMDDQFESKLAMVDMLPNKLKFINVELMARIDNLKAATDEKIESLNVRFNKL